MAKAAKSKGRTGGKPKKPRGIFGRAFGLIWAILRWRPVRFATRWGVRVGAVLAAVVFLLIVLFAFVNPPITHTIWAEQRRLGDVARDWVALEEIAPEMARAVVAAEDANFCLHWGFDVAAIRAAIAGGGQRGGSTISQQVAKNVFLWQGRSWLRKALETAITPVMEAIWTKRRIVEVYLNVAEMGEGVFGAEAAARQHFGVGAESLSATQAARIAAILPSPRKRSAARPSPAMRKRAAAIREGAATIAADGRASCFED